MSISDQIKSLEKELELQAQLNPGYAKEIRRVLNGEIPTYPCTINEYQRVVMRDLLVGQTLRPDMVEFLKAQPGMKFETMYEEVQTLIDLLNLLPTYKQAHPDSTYQLYP